MKTSELRAKDVAALEKEVSDLLKAHFGLRMQKATQQLGNNAQLGRTRRDYRARQDHPRREEEGCQMIEAQQAAATAKNTRTLIGRVVSDKRSKTVTVLVERRAAHELYGKIVARSRKYHAHDEKGEFKLGDVVAISECRPISKTKAWVVTRLVEKAKLV